jgi:hypothetical protein
MIIKRFFAAAALAVLIGTTASAAPTASLSGVKSGSLYNWTLSFTPDTSLFAPNPPQGTGGSLGVAFQIEVASGAITNPVVSTPNFQETISSTQIIGIGFDPYDTGDGISTNIQTYTGVPSDLATGTVNALFVPLGSTYFTTGGPKTALTFTTAANSVRFGGIVAQASTEYTIAAQVKTIQNLLGDANNDLAVTGADLGAVTSNFGNVGTNDGSLLGDANDDGAVTGADLGAVTSNFGNVLAPGALSATTIPEPSSLVMALVLAGGVAFGVSRRS